MDIRKFAVSETARIQINDPQGDAIPGAFVTVYGPGSRQHAQAQTNQQNKLMARLKKKAGDITVDQKISNDAAPDPQSTMYGAYQQPPPQQAAQYGYPPQQQPQYGQPQQQEQYGYPQQQGAMTQAPPQQQQPTAQQQPQVVQQQQPAAVVEPEPTPAEQAEGGTIYVDTQHDDMVHDAQLDYYGTKLATGSSGEFYFVVGRGGLQFFSFVEGGEMLCPNLGDRRGCSFWRRGNWLAKWLSGRMIL